MFLPPELISKINVCMYLETFLRVTNHSGLHRKLSCVSHNEAADFIIPDEDKLFDLENSNADIGFISAVSVGSQWIKETFASCGKSRDLNFWNTAHTMQTNGKQHFYFELLFKFPLPTFMLPALNISNLIKGQLRLSVKCIHLKKGSRCEKYFVHIYSEP